MVFFAFIYPHVLCRRFFFIFRLPPCCCLRLFGWFWIFIYLFFLHGMRNPIALWTLRNYSSLHFLELNVRMLLEDSFPLAIVICCFFFSSSSSFSFTDLGTGFVLGSLMTVLYRVWNIWQVCPFFFSFFILSTNHPVATGRIFSRVFFESSLRSIRECASAVFFLLLLRLDLLFWHGWVWSS